jgi:hypothetical protein
MSGDFVDELFQSTTTTINEVRLVNAVITSEWNVTLPSFAGQLRYHNLAVSFELVAQPFEVAVPTSYERFFVFEDRQIGLKRNGKYETKKTVRLECDFQGRQQKVNQPVVESRNR